MKSKRAWLTFATIDAVLLVSAGSAMAAPAVVVTAPMHLPALLLAGIGLVGCGLKRRPLA